MEATLHGQEEIMRYLVNFNTLLGFEIDDLDDAGRNVLFYLVEHKNMDLLEFLLNCGVLIEPANDGRTLIMTAALKNNEVLIKYLVENADKLGLDINEKDGKGRNCLFYCITGSTIAIFQYLMTKGVPIQTGSDGVTLMMQAVAKNKADFLHHLIDNSEVYGLGIDTRDKDGWNAMLYAVASGHLHLFK